MATFTKNGDICTATRPDQIVRLKFNGWREVEESSSAIVLGELYFDGMHMGDVHLTRTESEADPLVADPEPVPAAAPSALAVAEEPPASAKTPRSRRRPTAVPTNPTN